MSERKPWVSPFDEDNQPVPGPSLGDSVRGLTTVVTKLAAQYRAKRWRDRLNYATTVAVVLFLGYYFLLVLPDRREDTSEQIKDLACYAVRFRPPGYSDTSDALRMRYSCPPFNPSLAPSGAPSVEPTPGSTVTRSVPGPTRTVTRPAEGPRLSDAPEPTVTRTVVPAARTVTVTPAARTRTVMRTVPGPTVTRGICVAGVLC